MTLNEAIKHEEEVTKIKEKEANGFIGGSLSHIECLDCAREHRQLAEWLKELKRYRESDEAIK